MLTKKELRDDIKNNLYRGNALKYELFMSAPIPFLQMKTPNQAIKSAEGRETLAALVNAIRTGDFS